VAPIDPILGLDAAVTRRTIDGANPGGWVPEQRVTLEETLRAYTAGSARAGYADDRLGRIAPGMLADLVVLDRDIFQEEPDALVATRVDVTVVDGEVLYRRD
jgi:predicted amidohydrolase YtcJ